MRSSQNLFAMTSFGVSMLLAAGCGQGPIPADRDRHHNPGLREDAADAPRRQLAPEVRRSAADVQRAPHQRHGDAQRQHAGVPAEDPAELGLHGAPCAVQHRHLPLGLQHQRHRRLLFPARTIEARRTAPPTTAIYTNSLTNTRLQSLLTRRSVVALGRPARHDRAEQLRQRPAAGGALHAALRRPDPGRRPPARRRGAVAVRRPPRGLVHAGTGAARARLRQQHVQLRQHPGGHHAVVPRPLAGRGSRERLRRSRRHVLHPRHPRHRRRQQPDHAAVGRAGVGAVAGRQAVRHQRPALLPRRRHAGRAERRPGKPRQAPVLDSGVLRRRHHRQRQGLAGDGRAAAALSLPRA